MEDNDLMPWGKYQGTKMLDVPASYLIWIYENNKCSGDVKKYIEENMQCLKDELK